MFNHFCHFEHRTKMVLELKLSITCSLIYKVHKQAFYLQKLIQSLASVRGINSTILVFSHDYFSDDINGLVNSIDFAPVLQIFFPFSTQLYPDEFPGTSPQDCPWNLDINKAKTQGCVGADTPDGYNHFRQANITQAKHHWWWKINTVFENLNVTKNFNGFVLFLEEDHYLAPDALHILRLMTGLAADQCSECNSFHIGTFRNANFYQENSDKVYVAPWNNLGFAFNRTLWQVLKRCSCVFCNFDDYNWDWSFDYTVQECFPKKITSLVVYTSRVFHIGSCGMHQKRACSLNQSLTVATDNLESMKPFLFPESLKLEYANFLMGQVEKGWGGWSDPRDIELCLNISHMAS